MLCWGLVCGIQGLEMVTCFYPQLVLVFLVRANNNNVPIVTILHIPGVLIIIYARCVYALRKHQHVIIICDICSVLMAEVVKLVTCLILVYAESGGVVQLFDAIDRQIIKQPVDTLKVCVPSLVYVIQNNLLYVSASHLDAATYQVTYQLKILTTAVFAVLILRKQLLRTQWLSLLLLVAGVVLVQLAQSGSNTVQSGPEQNRFIGFIAALSACVLSGFAGVFFEKMLKGSDITVWMRNVQLSICSIPFAFISCFAYDGHVIAQQGFFFGYDKFVYYLVVLQAGGGLIVAVVVKFADNILKGFATSLAIVISCIASIYLFEFHLTVQFSFGAACVIGSIFLYGHTPKKTVSPFSTHKV